MTEEKRKFRPLRPPVRVIEGHRVVIRRPPLSVEEQNVVRRKWDAAWSRKVYRTVLDRIQIRRTFLGDRDRHWCTIGDVPLLTRIFIYVLFAATLLAALLFCLLLFFLF